MRITLPGGWYNRLIESYGFERDRGEHSILWTTPSYFPQPSGQAGRMLDEAFNKYRLTKGVIPSSRLEGQTFLKCTSHGRVFIVRLLTGGELREALINDLSEWWHGGWIVTGGIENRDRVLEPQDPGFLVTNIGAYSTALFPDKSSELLSGPEHGAHSAQAFVWMGHVTQRLALDSVLGHIPNEYHQWIRTVISAYVV